MSASYAQTQAFSERGTERRVSYETYIDLLPKTHEQRDNHKSGCWFASLVTTHQKD